MWRQIQFVGVWASLTPATQLTALTLWPQPGGKSPPSSLTSASGAGTRRRSPSGAAALCTTAPGRAPTAQRAGWPGASRAHTCRALRTGAIEASPVGPRPRVLAQDQEAHGSGHCRPQDLAPYCRLLRNLDVYLLSGTFTGGSEKRWSALPGAACLADAWKSGVCFSVSESAPSPSSRVLSPGLWSE